MRFASYGRKSVFSDKSDSVDNQRRMCRDYCDVKFNGEIESWDNYSDEDYSGSNTDRPDLKRLLTNIKDGMYDALVVYQLDRLSRDVRDFANIYSVLEEHNVMFISIKENIDTTTPIGRAMMYVTVVFAQMERETIAARVTDNMIGLAKKGLWTGGNPPYGYIRQRIELNGRKHVTIVPDPDGVKYVTWLFDTFLENNYSLQGMETAFRNQGIKTLSGKFFSTTQLHKTLTMPYCVEATPEIYDFYESKGCQMATPRDMWDGSHGVMIYGRSSEKTNKHRTQPKEKWIVCIGLHKPFIPADKWLAVQERFAQNTFDKTKKYPISLLKGTLRCSCGNLMHVARKHWEAGMGSYYHCTKRTRQGPEACNMHQIRCDILDDKVLEVFREIQVDQALIRQYTKMVTQESVPEVPPIDYEKQIEDLKKQIGRLAATVATSENSSAVPYLLKEIERLDLNLQAARRELEINKANEKRKKIIRHSAEERAKEIADFISNLENFNADERNAIVKSVVQECVWDGETLTIRF